MQKLLIRTLLLTAVTLPWITAAPAPDPDSVTLVAGTQIPIRLGQSLDTRRDHAGAGFIAHLSAPIVRNGEVILPRGAVCHGHVVESRASGRLKGRALMRLSIDSIESNGHTYRVDTSDPAIKSLGHKKRNLALIGAATGATIGAIAGGGVGAAVGAGAGAAAGTVTAAVTGKRHLHLAAETRLVFALREPVHVRA
jgi:hypothetical protein